MQPVKHYLSGSITMALLLATVVSMPVSALAETGNTDLSSGKPKHEHSDCQSHKGCKGMHHKDGCSNPERVFDKLNLTQDQKDRLKASRESFRQHNQAAFESLKAQSRELRDLKAKNGKDDPQVQALRKQVMAEHRALFEKRDASLQAILTPEQYTQYKTERKKAWGDRRAQWKQKREEREQQHNNAPSSAPGDNG